MIGKNANEAMNAKGRILQLARSTYTMPPDHGAAIVETILSSEELTKEWKAELDVMRNRIITLRSGLTAALATRCGDDRFNFIKQHQGMFSMLGLSQEQVARLKDEFAIYAVGDSRINIAGLTESRIDYLADALMAVVK